MKDKKKFYGNLEEDVPNESSLFCRKYLEDCAFNRVFLEAEKETMYWRRFKNDLIKSKISTPNYSGELVEIPVFVEGQMVPGNKDLSLFLLEPGKGPCIRGTDKRMGRLFSKITYNIFSGTKPEFLDE